MEIAAGKFKAQCLQLMDLVSEQNIELIITKRGKPVARLLPPEPVKSSFLFGSMRGTVEILGDIVEPLGTQDWEAASE